MISSERPAAQYRVTEAKTKRCEGTLPFDPASLGISFRLEYARCSLFGEMKRIAGANARLTVTVTRYGNARNAPLYQFRFAARGRSRPERRSANSREDGEDRACKRKEIIIPLSRKYAGWPNMHLRGALRSLYRDIFSRPSAVAGYRSFASAKWNERALQRIPAAKRETG